MTDVLATIEQVQAQLQRVKDTDLPDLQRHLDAATHMITDICVPLLPATVTDKLDGGQATVLLSTYPINAITSVEVYDSAGSSTAVLEAGGVTGLIDGWRLDSLTGVLHRVGWRYWPVGWGNVVVTYTVGPDVPPADAVQACVLLTEHLWQFRKITHQPALTGNDPQGYSPTYAMPNKVLEMLRPYLKPARIA